MRGFTLVELMVVIVIFTIIVAGIFGVLYVGKENWYTGTTQIDLQEETRKAMRAIVKELRESGFAGGTSKVNISGGGGIITFQVPVVPLDAADDDGTLWNDINGDDVRDANEFIWNFLDANQNIEWGAPLHYHCRNPFCESAGVKYDTCHYSDYEIRYLASANQLLRRVFDDTGTQVKEDILANNISNIQFGGNGNPVSRINIQITAQKDTIQGRSMQLTLDSEISLRNFRN